MLGLSLERYWAMPFREYHSLVKGYLRTTNDHRMELKAISYPIYRACMAALGKGNTVISYDDYLPTSGEKKEPLSDPKRLLREAYYRLNPHKRK